MPISMISAGLPLLLRSDGLASPERTEVVALRSPSVEFRATNLR